MWLFGNLFRKRKTAKVEAGLAVSDLLDDIIRREGGYVNNPLDRGGPTNFGITKQTLRECRGKPVSIGDVRRLTVEEAKDIYRSRYYVETGISTLPSLIQPAVLDFAVHSGQSRAIRVLQAVCNAMCSFAEPLSIDGKIGPRTRLAVRTTLDRNGEAAVIDNYCERRLAFLDKIIQKDPSQAVFRRGWEKRVRGLMSGETRK